MRDDEDPQHYQYMVSVGDHAIIEGLGEDERSWSYRGPVRILKTRPYFEIGRELFPLHPGTHFYKRPFSTPHPSDPTREVRGVSLWFEKFPMDPPQIGKSLTLCGWVPPEREAELDGWIAFLNGKITERLAAAPVDPADRQMSGSLAFIESLGLKVPKGDTVDQVMDSLKKMAQADGPVSGNPTPPDDGGNPEK